MKRLFGILLIICVIGAAVFFYNDMLKEDDADVIDVNNIVNDSIGSPSVTINVVDQKNCDEWEGYIHNSGPNGGEYVDVQNIEKGHSYTFHLKDGYDYIAGPGPIWGTGIKIDGLEMFFYDYQNGRAIFNLKHYKGWCRTDLVSKPGSDTWNNIWYYDDKVKSFVL
jgi:hypothetical protein